MFEVVPATSWEDVQVVFGRTEAYRCQCQRFTIGRYEWTPPPWEERAARLRDSLQGLLAFDGDEPVGWCAVGPRPSYPLLATSRSPVPFAGRAEDPADEGVWAITCFVVRKGHRRQGVQAALVAATVPYAREHGARALEGYPMIAPAGKEVIWDELFVGAVSSFEDAGFVEVSAPTKRRRVMRIELSA